MVKVWRVPQRVWLVLGAAAGRSGSFAEGKGGTVVTGMAGGLESRDTENENGAFADAIATQSRIFTCAQVVVGANNAPLIAVESQYTNQP